MKKIFIFLIISLSLINATKYLMPHEDYLHKRTWMGFPSTANVWGKDLPNVQKDLVFLAKTISKYEPVNLIVNSEKEKLKVQTLLANTAVKTNYAIELIIQPINDLWLRDTGSVFVFTENKQEMSGVDFNFNGWGKKQTHNFDKNIAKFMTEYSNVYRMKTELVLEGGGLEVDGEGTAILAESCILNKNRNPGWTKDDVEEELSHLLGIEKFIWVPGVKGEDITDGHIDFYARFAGKSRPSYVLVHMDESDPSTKENLEIIKNSKDAKGRKLTPIIMNTPNHKKMRKSIIDSGDSAIGYCNFYVLNNAVILANFGDKEADENARKVLEFAFPGRTIDMIQVDNIVNGGGSVHCSTQQEYASKTKPSA